MADTTPGPAPLPRPVGVAVGRDRDGFVWRCFHCSTRRGGYQAREAARVAADAHLLIEHPGQIGTERAAPVTPSRTDRQPRDSATEAKGGETPVRPETTKHPDLVTHHEET